MEAGEREGRRYIGLVLTRNGEQARQARQDVGEKKLGNLNV